MIVLRVKVVVGDHIIISHQLFNNLNKVFILEGSSLYQFTLH